MSPRPSSSERSDDGQKVGADLSTLKQGTGRRYQTTGPRQSRFTRGWKLLALLALLLAILVVAIVPAAVITTRNKSNSESQQSAEIVETTVVNGLTQTITRTGRLQTQTVFSTAADGQVLTQTSVITAAPVTVSRTSIGAVATGKWSSVDLGVGGEERRRCFFIALWACRDSEGAIESRVRL